MKPAVGSASCSGTPAVACRAAAVLVSCTLALSALLPAATGGMTGRTAPGAGLGCVLEIVYEPFAGLILVPVSVDGSPPMDFVLDTGASQSSLTDPFLASALGLEVREAGLARGMGAGAKQVLVTEDASLASQGFEFMRAPLALHDIGVLLARTAGRDLHGFIGSGLLAKYVLEIDPPRRRLVLHDPADFTYRGMGTEVPLETVEGRPVVEGRVVVRTGRKPVPIRLLVDTGSSRLLTLFTGSRRQLRAPDATVKERGIGVLGPVDVEVAPIEILELGSLRIAGIDTAWVESFRVPAAASIAGLNGILGNGLLGRFRVVIDTHGGRLILEPVPSGAE